MRLLVCSILLVAGLSGCLDGEVETNSAPVIELPPLPEVVTGFGDILETDLPGSQGIWIHNGILYTTNGGSLRIADLADPTNPVLLGEVLNISARDVDVIEWNERTYAVLAGSGKGMHFVDVTDPAVPALIATIELPHAGVHNLAVVPGTPYIYSSGASGDARVIDVADITDPFNPVAHSFPIPAEMNGMAIESDGCHDITVRVDLGRAYCAGGGGKYAGRGGETFIWNITDEAGGILDPTWVSMMDDPRIKYHHQAFANDNGTILIIDDEFIAPNCVGIDVPGVPGAYDPKVPTAAAWVWDISDEANPVMRSFVQNPSGADPMGFEVPEASGEGVFGAVFGNANCGSHFGELIPGHNMFVMGWYGGGTMLVDFADPDNAAIVDILETEGSTWDARLFGGYVYHSSGPMAVTPLI